MCAFNFEDEAQGWRIMKIFIQLKIQQSFITILMLTDEIIVLAKHLRLNLASFMFLFFFPSTVSSQGLAFYLREYCKNKTNAKKKEKKSVFEFSINFAPMSRKAL